MQRDHLQHYVAWWALCREVSGAVWAEEQLAELLGHGGQRSNRHWAASGGPESPGCNPVYTRRRVWSASPNKALKAHPFASSEVLP